MPQTASPTEWYWTLMALPGLVLSIYNVWGAVNDLRNHWTDDLRGMGCIGLAKVGVVGAMATLVIIAGVIALMTPDPIRPEVQDAADLLSSIFLTLDALILTAAVLFSLERAYVVPHIHMLRDRR